MYRGQGLVVKQLLHPTPTRVHTRIFQQLKSSDSKSLPVAPNASVVLQDKDAGEDLV